MQTEHELRSNLRTRAWPMPPAPPVTIALFPLTLNIFTSSRFAHGHDLLFVILNLIFAKMHVCICCYVNNLQWKCKKVNNKGQTVQSSQDNGLIFLWVTGRAMELGRECLKLWGYERVDELIWVKTNQLQRIIRTGEIRKRLLRTWAHISSCLSRPNWSLAQPRKRALSGGDERSAITQQGVRLWRHRGRGKLFYWDRLQ